MYIQYIFWVYVYHSAPLLNKITLFLEPDFPSLPPAILLATQSHYTTQISASFVMGSFKVEKKPPLRKASRRDKFMFVEK